MSADFVFDEAAYLLLNPDVAAAVADGVFASGREHFELHGRSEGRLVIDPAIIATCRHKGEKYGVPSEIHPGDFIFWFVYQHPRFPTKAEAIEYYFANGQESADKLRELVGRYSTIVEPTILEFAAGYGSVSRHLKTRFAQATFTSCDIHPAALDFISGHIGIPTIASAHSPEEFDAGQKFDSLFAISFFSHIPDRAWQRWVRALSEQVKPGGLLIFTTNGRTSMSVVGATELNENGYWFVPQSEQVDLDGEEYGSTVTSFEYVYRQIVETSGVRLIKYDPAFWFTHQDLYVLRKT
jgi:SAM-dependent methyltransferase